MRKFTVLSLCLTLMMGATACASRLPSKAHSERLIKRYFAHYGRDYPETPFHNRKVARIEFLSQDEIQQGLAESEVFLSLAGASDDLVKARITFKKRTLRWKILNWEDLSPRAPGPSTPPPSS